MGKKYYWLKIGEFFFETDEIIYLESLDKGDTYIKIWMKILLKCLKDKDEHEYGFLRFTEKIPYDDKLLSKVLKVDINDLRVAMQYFQDLGMVQILDDKTIYIESVQKMVGKESDSAERVRKHREKKKLIENKCYNVTEESVTVNANKEVEVEVEVEYNQNVIRASEYLLKQILKHGNSQKYANNNPDIKKWYDDIDKLNRIDGINFDDIIDVIEFATKDKFWKANILSGKALRRNYDKLYNQMKR